MAKTAAVQTALQPDSWLAVLVEGAVRPGTAWAGTARAAVPSAAARDPRTTGSEVRGGAELGGVHNCAANGAVPVGGAGRAGDGGARLRVVRAERPGGGLQRERGQPYAHEMVG